MNINKWYDDYVKVKMVLCELEYTTDHEYKIVTEADIETKIKDTNDVIVKKITLLDKLKAKYSHDNEVYLATYEDLALQCKPVGLQVPYIETLDDQFDSMVDRVDVMLKSKEKEALKIDDIPTLKGWIDINIKQDGMYNEMFNILYGTSKSDWRKYATTERKRNITTSDIRKAITVLKNIDTEFASAIDELKAQQRLIDAQLSTNTIPGQMAGTLNSSVEEYHDTVRLNIIALRKILVSEILKVKNKLNALKQQNARHVVSAAAKYKPKSYRESMDTIMIGFIGSDNLDFSDMDELLE